MQLTDLTWTTGPYREALVCGVLLTIICCTQWLHRTELDVQCVLVIHVNGTAALEQCHSINRSINLSITINTLTEIDNRWKLEKNRRAREVDTSDELMHYHTTADSVRVYICRFESGMNREWTTGDNCSACRLSCKLLILSFIDSECSPAYIETEDFLIHSERPLAAAVCCTVSLHYYPSISFVAAVIWEHLVTFITSDGNIDIDRSQSAHCWYGITWPTHLTPPRPSPSYNTINTMVALLQWLLWTDVITMQA